MVPAGDLSGIRVAGGRHRMQAELTILDVDEAWRGRVRSAMGEMAARHMHLSDGFTLIAVDGRVPAGLIAVVWRDLPPPLTGCVEGFIDIIEVAPEYRRRGVATALVEMAAARARERRAYQLRAWSSEDKTEAIPMWRALGFGLCPAVEHGRGLLTLPCVVREIPLQRMELRTGRKSVRRHRTRYCSRVPPLWITRNGTVMAKALDRLRFRPRRIR